MKHRIPRARRARRVLAALSALTLAGLTVLAGSIPAQATPGETLDSSRTTGETDIAVDLTASASLLFPDGIKYTLTVTNNGPSHVENAIVGISRSSVRDFNLRGVSGPCDNHMDDLRGWVIECDIPNIAVGSQSTTSFEVELRRGLSADLRLTASTYVNDLQVDGENDARDTNPNNNFAEASCTVATSLVIVC